MTQLAHSSEEIAVMPDTLLAWPQNLVFLDLETTGLNPWEHGIIEIGAVKPDGQTIEIRCSPRAGASIDDEALAVNGSSRVEILARTIPCFQALRSLAQWLGEPPEGMSWIIAGKNPRFDYDFLRWVWNHYVSEINFTDFPEMPFGHRVFDLHSLVYAWAIARGWNLTDNINDIYELLGIHKEPRPHHALQGAEHARAAFAKMIAQFIGDTVAEPVPVKPALQN